MLRGAAAVPVVIAVGAAVTACGPTVDEQRTLAELLVRHAQAAVRQQKAAQSLAPRVTEYTAALGVLAEQRGKHAQALRDEVNRLHSSSAAQIDDPGPAITTLDALRTAVTTSTKAAATDAVDGSGFSAGLLASVSASCRTLTEVQLA
ncbi:hypothetical protein nbrc107696_29500 [Gordonia spumicola]|uniref:Lipoprotein n=1 Tax=Gordonia spumicola TaxID=589161 RepID=A0A7I9VB59_9ACTN|nr:hypothetical protein [Gordonia spumicola]GEE02504.1 hypothetical protein nbrc107696_29500 [Gordonia spumicola]